MKLIRSLLVLSLLPLARPLAAQVPSLVNYQGRVAVGAVNFDGAGQFKFALVAPNGTTTYWSNDGTSTAGSQPTAAVALTVTKGLYSVLLGDSALAGMTAIPASVFANADVRLRVWFNDGTNGFQLLTPDQRLAPNGYLPDGSVSTANIAAGAVGSAQLATNAVQTANIASGAISSTQLASNAVQSANIAAGAVGSTQMANASVTAAKLQMGTEAGTTANGSLNAVTGLSTFTDTFSQSFSTPPTVSLLSPGWTLGAVTATGFSATTPSVPTVLDGASTNVGEAVSMAIINGNPAVAYYDATSLQLRYIRATNASGTAWGTSVIAAATGGKYCSLAVVGGFPAITYRDTNARLEYVRATDADGVAWGAPVTVGSDFTTYTSLAVVSGTPAIAYRDGTTGYLKYIRASNVAGTSWGTPVVLSGDIITFPTLMVVGGVPVIGYYATGANTLFLVRATSADGTGAWGGSPIEYSAGNGASMALVNGLLAVTYSSPTGVRYRRATDAAASTWGASVVVDTALADSTSLAFVNGAPCLTYYSSVAGELRFLQAKDTNGAGWSVPQVLDTEGFVGLANSLKSVNGTPGVAYYDFTNGDLKYLNAPQLKWLANDGTVAPLVANIPAGAVNSVQLAANLTLAGTTTGTFSGNGSALTNLNPAAISPGTAGISITGNAASATTAATAASVPASGITGTIGNAQLAADAVTSANIANGTITPSDINTSIIGLWGLNGTNAYYNSGRVGIGTTGPACLLDVVGGTDIASPADLWVRYTGGANDWAVEGANTAHVSIRGSHYISALGYISTSDARMKNITGRSPGAADLQTLLAIEITDYHFKDTIGKGSTPQKKVIAQQVEKVFPQAVSRATDVVPDIFQKAPVADGWVLLATDLKKGERVKLIGAQEQSIHEVLEVAAGKFRTAALPAGSEVFVYGREVDDFRHVDYEAIAMLNVSATQELARRLQAQEDENAALKKQLATLTTKLDQVIAVQPATPTKAIAKK